MFETVLVPLDGSARAESVLRQVEPLLKRPSCEVILLRTVWSEPSLLRIDYGRKLQEDRAEALEYLHGLIRRHEAEGMKVRGLVREGPPAEMILETSRSHGVDLIAMSTHGASGIRRWMLGSVSEKVIRASDAPVLLLRSFGPRAAAAEPGWVPFRKILAPTDGSEHSLAVIPFVEELAAVYSAEVTLLHVDDRLRIPVGLPQAALVATTPFPSPWAAPEPMSPAAQDALLQAASGRFKDSGRVVHRRLERGDAAGEILNAAKSGGFDLIAMSTHGRRGVSRWVFGSVTEKVLRHASVPLLVVRPRFEEA